MPTQSFLSNRWTLLFFPLKNIKHLFAFLEVPGRSSRVNSNFFCWKANFTASSTTVECHLSTANVPFCCCVKNWDLFVGCFNSTNRTKILKETKRGIWGLCYLCIQLKTNESFPNAEVSRWDLLAWEDWKINVFVLKTEYFKPSSNIFRWILVPQPRRKKLFQLLACWVLLLMWKNSISLSTETLQ